MGLSRSRILLALLAALVFLPFLGARDVVISHEARVIQTARQMAEAGWPWDAKKVAVPDVHLVKREDLGGALRLDPDPGAPPLVVNPWLVPVLNDEIRLQKPPLPYWCCALLFRAAGGWNEMLARVVTAVLGALGTFLVYGLAGRMLGKRFAMAAGVVWVSSYFVPDEFRKTMADPYLAFFVLLSCWGWVRGRSASGRGPRAGRLNGWLGFYVGLGTGFFAKGPVVLVHVVVPLVVWEVGRWRKFRVLGSQFKVEGGRTSNIEVEDGSDGALHSRSLWWVHVVGVGVALLIALPWYSYVLSHVPHAREIWRYESVGEMTDNVENARPFWFYLPLVFQISLPWTVVWAIGMGWGIWRRRWRLAVPAIWWGLIVLFFSMVHLKKGAYLLPGMPAQTMAIAVGVVGLMGVVRRFGATHWGGWVLAGTTLVLLFVAATLPVIESLKGKIAEVRPMPFTGAVMLSVLSLRELFRRRVRVWLGWMGGATALVLFGFFNFFMTPAENARSPRHAAREVQTILSRGPEFTIVPGKLPPELTLYLPLDVNFNPGAKVVVYVLDDPKKRSAVDVASFEKRLGMGVRSVMEVRGGGRYRVFEVLVEGKVLAGNVMREP